MDAAWVKCFPIILKQAVHEHATTRCPDRWFCARPLHSQIYWWKEAIMLNCMPKQSKYRTIALVGESLLFSISNKKTFLGKELLVREILEILLFLDSKSSSMKTIRQHWRRFRVTHRKKRASHYAEEWRRNFVFSKRWFAATEDY